MNSAAESALLKFHEENPLFDKEMILLEKNENSGLARKVMPCNREFFEKLFNSVFWKAYNEFGLASMPFDSRYLAFIADEMFFCRNTEERFLRRIGPEKAFSYSNEGISERVPLNIANIAFIAAQPFELARNAARVSVAALKINGELGSFGEHYNRSFSFWKENSAAEDPLTVVQPAMEGALASMRYSLISSLAMSLKIRLKASFAAGQNLMKEIIESARNGRREGLLENFGFFSFAPYDSSRPFLWEDPAMIELLAGIPVPIEPHYVWRENAKLCCAMHLSVLRKAFIETGRQSGIGNEIFYLKPSELSLALSDKNIAKGICLKRKAEFKENQAFLLPARIALKGGKAFFEKEHSEKGIFGFSVGSKSQAEGRLVFVESTADRLKVSEGDIIFSKSFSPELVIFYGKCLAVVSETGGMLAHSAIVAREMGLPCVVQVKGAGCLKEGVKVKVDGSTGKITLV
ncbi:MAG: PEP-utilizing enzyme [Candidatus Diapherotrites archaeon]